MPPAAGAAAVKRRRTGHSAVDNLPLSDSDILQYELAGWVRLPRAFSPTTAAACREVMWTQLEKHCGLCRHEPEAWSVDERHSGSNGLNKLSMHPVFSDVGSSRMMVALQQLEGTHNARSAPPPPPKSWGGFLVTFPRRILGSPHLQPPWWRIPRDGIGTGWHWDGSPCSWLDKPSHGVKVFTLFSDVAPRGGATLLLEGSHRLLDAFFRSLPESKRTTRKQNPLKKMFYATHPWIGALTVMEQAAGSPTMQQALEKKRIFEYMDKHTAIDGVPLRVVECCGDAGDAFLVNPLMYHSSAPNCRATPRFMRSTLVTTS
eukprot:SAG31_NODE_3871_length_3796_cov_3.386696_1_plen_317_part_00